MATRAGSLRAIRDGADYVLGVDGRTIRIEQAECDFDVKLVPSARAVHDLASRFGYRSVTLKPDFRNPKGLRD